MIRIPEQNMVAVIAVYPDHGSMERALRRLHDDGFEMHDVSVVGRVFEATELPADVVTTGDLAGVSAELGAVAGLLCGLAIGTAFLVLPGFGPVLIAGSLSATLAGGVEGALVGAVIGGLGGALVEWGITSAHMQIYETHVNEGRFLVIARTHPDGVEYTQWVLAPGAVDQPEVFEPSAVSA
jgi:hypothetical protein